MSSGYVPGGVTWIVVSPHWDYNVLYIDHQFVLSIAANFYSSPPQGYRVIYRCCDVGVCGEFGFVGWRVGGVLGNDVVPGANANAGDIGWPLFGLLKKVRHRVFFWGLVIFPYLGGRYAKFRYGNRQFENLWITL